MDASTSSSELPNVSSPTEVFVFVLSLRYYLCVYEIGDLRWHDKKEVCNADNLCFHYTLLPRQYVLLLFIWNSVL